MKLTTEQEDYYYLKYSFTLTRLNLIAKISKDLVEFNKNILASVDISNRSKHIKGCSE